MAIDLTDMSLKQLEKLRADIDKAIQNAKDRGLKAARKAAEEAAAEFGFSLTEVVGAGGSGRKSARRSVAAGVAKYRNPADASQTWTGKGRQPAWFKDAIAKGTDPSKMEI